MEEQSPPHWAEDKLSEYFELTHRNSFHIFAHHKEVYKLFEHLNQIFSEIVKYVDPPRELGEVPAILFFTMARSSYMVAVKLAFGGQLPESYAVLRQCLENSLIAFFIFKEIDKTGEIDVFELWLKRNDSQENKNKVRNKFGFKKLIKFLGENGNKKIGEVVTQLYEATIERGAHVNESALTQNLRVIKEEPRKSKFKLSYVTNIKEMPEAYSVCLKSIAEIGLASLSIFELIFKEKFKLVDISFSNLNVSETIKYFKKNYGNILRKFYEKIRGEQSSGNIIEPKDFKMIFYP